jgi:microcystin-dependent protein
MSDQFIGELRLVGFNFAPYQWAQAQGQLLPISQNTALFSLLGTFYGGNGTTTFALPNLQGNVVVGAGQAPGLSLYDLGEWGGSQSVTLQSSNVPMHTHTFQADSRPADLTNPGGHALAKTSADNPIYSPSVGTSVQLNQSFLSLSGGSQAHNNMMPYLALNWVIALVGIFPTRN